MVVMAGDQYSPFWAGRSSSLRLWGVGLAIALAAVAVNRSRRPGAGAPTAPVAGPASSPPRAGATPSTPVRHGGVSAPDEVPFHRARGPRASR